MTTHLLSVVANNDAIAESTVKVLWNNPEYTVQNLELLWKERDSLLTIGTGGATKKHINSMNDLVNQHRIVRIKFANDKIDAMTVSRDCIDDELLAGKVEILQVRPRGFMIGKKKLEIQSTYKNWKRVA